MSSPIARSFLIDAAKRPLSLQDVHAARLRIEKAVGRAVRAPAFSDSAPGDAEEVAPATAALNLALTVLGGFMAGWLGLITAREVLGR